MKMIRRCLSLFLTIGLLASLFAGLSLTAFAEEGDVTLSFAGAEAEVITGAEGDSVTLPAAEVTQDGYTFLGWTDAAVSKTTAEPVYYTAGSSYTLPSADKTLYALYSYIDHRGTPSIDRYEKITSMDDLKDGSYLIGVETTDNQLLVFDGSSENPNSSGNYQILALTATDTVACSAAADACAVRVYQLPDSEAYGIKMGNGSGKYIGSTGSTGMASRGTEPYPLTIEFDDGILIYVSTADKNLYLSYYQTSSTQRFGFYNNTSSYLVNLYRKIDGIDGTLYYTGTVTECDHAGTEGVLTEATCTEDGFMTYLCATCGYKWVEEGDAAIGHNYTATVTEPTASTQGYTTHVCSNCGDTYIDNYVDPFGTDFDIEFVVLGESWRTETVNSYQGTDLPTPDVLPDGYTFAGWATKEYPNETTTATILTGTYKPTEDVTLYAVYKRSEFAAGSGDYKKLTSMPSGGLNGQFLVVCEAKGIAFNSAFATSASNLNKAGNYLPVTISSSTIAATSELDAASVKIAPVGTTGNYSMEINSGLMIGSTGSSTANGINGKSGTVYQNKISFNKDGTAVIANAPETNTNGASGTTYNFAYNSSSVNRFAYCKPSTTTVHEVCLYQKQEGTTTYFYTTAPATAGCEHEAYSTVVTDPTCVDAGYTTYTCTNCGYKWTEEGEAAPGHSYDEGVVTDPTPTAVGYTTYTCTVCGDTYQDNLVGFEFEITYNVLGTDREPVIVNNKDGADFPTDVPEIDGYKFAGWAEEAIPEEINNATVLAGHYIPTEDATYYAVYTRKEANTGDGNYYKVTSLPLVANGNYLIVDEMKGYAFKAFEEDNEDYDLTKANNYISVSISGNTIAESIEADFASVVINPEEGTANFVMTGSETGAYIGTTGSSTGIMENTKNPYPVTIAYSDANAVICNVNGNTIYQLAYNTQSTSNKFGFFATTNKNADPVCLYCKDGSGFTTYYTTQPEIDCIHDDITEVEEVPATCTSTGFTAGVFCNDCQTYISGHKIIEKTAHTPEELPAVPATCTETGLTAGSKCSVCGEILVAQDVIPLAEHQYGMDENSDPTCAQPGFINWVCEVCGDSYEETIPATGEHTYDANGICSECGDKLITIESAALRLDEDIDVIYTAKVPEGATATMTFTMNGESATVADDGTHTFAFEGVNPQCMGDNISATLTVTVGESTYTCTKDEYSVRAYCISQLAKTEDANLRTLLSDVLAYGAAAQTYMSYNTEALVNSGDDILNPTYSTYIDLSGLSATFEGTASENIYWVGAGLKLTNSVAMRFRFYAASVDGLTVNVTINGRTQSFTASDFTAVEGKTDIYEISFTGIKASEFSDAVTASFSNGGNTVSYSVNSYVCAKQADSDANLAALVKALYNYGAAAEAYTK